MSKQLLKIEDPAAGLKLAGGGMALWRLGFRPFYILAALFAMIGVPLWVLAYAGAATLAPGLSPQLWHSHEMVFGFALAVIIGFLFTAVRNWTNRPTPTGGRLMLLAAIWVAVRASFLAGAVDLAVVLELLLLVLVAQALLSALLSAKNRRNYFVGILFVVLVVVDALFWTASAGWQSVVSAEVAVRFALYLVATLTFVIGGRVIPMFTANAVRGIRQFKDPRLDRAAIGFSVVAFALDLAGVSGSTLAVVAALAAVLQATRVGGWGPQHTFSKPILWILHVSYAWAAVGLALLAAAALGLVPRSLALHALAVGLIGGLIIGMITRTALGHTGRMLVAGRAELAMYLLLQLAAVLRVFGPLVAPGLTLRFIEISSVAWSAAFLVYLIAYIPILARPRIDGGDG